MITFVSDTRKGVVVEEEEVGGGQEGRWGGGEVGGLD